MQYRETDFNFVSRLMEHEGIYYYFKHDDGQHTLVLTDSNSGHSAFPGYEHDPVHRARACSCGRTSSTSAAGILARGSARRVRARRLRLRAAERRLAGEEERAAAVRAEQRTRCTTTRDTTSRSRTASRMRRVRIDEFAAQFETSHGRDQRARRRRSGCLFTLDGSSRARPEPRAPDRGGQLTICEFSQYEAMPDGGEADYRCELRRRCPRAEQFRPQRIDAEAVRPGPADGGGRRPGRRGDLHRQVRPREGAVPLGPAAARRTRTARAGSASRSRGPARTGARSPSRASARR